MVMLAESVDAVIGVDTHTDTHTACLIDHVDREIATVTVEANPHGYAGLLDWAVRRAPAPRLVWAVEGCRSHGAGLVRVLLANGQAVVEAGRPERAGRRPGGKSNPADARLAARTALTAPHHARPRSDGDREALTHPARCPRPRHHHPHRRGQCLQVAAADRPGRAAGTTAPAIDTPADRRVRQAACPGPSHTRPADPATDATRTRPAHSPTGQADPHQRTAAA